MSDISKVALIGVSNFGAVHYEEIMNLHKESRLKFAAATIVNQNEEQEKIEWLKAVGCEIFDDYRKMLAKFKNKLDLCYIPTGINHHKTMTIDALRAGANVFVEKPLCATMSDAIAMRNAELKYGKFVAVGYQHIYLPQTQKLKDLLLSGRLGKALNFKHYCFTARNKAYFERNDWAGKLRLDNGDWVLDSPFNNVFAHYLNQLLFLAGNSFERSTELKSVQAELYRARDYTESPDLGFIRMKSVDDKNIYFITGHAAAESKSMMHIECEKGIIRLSADETQFIVDFKDGSKEVLENKIDRGFINEALLAKLRGEKPFICSIDIAMTHTLSIAAAHKSSDIIRIPDEFIKNTNDKEKGELTIVKNLFTICDECYEKNLLPDELGSIPWSSKSKLVSLKNDKSKGTVKCAQKASEPENVYAY